MAERLVVDSGPLIALGRSGALDAIGSLGVVVVAPDQVRVELEEGARRGHVGITPSWLTFVALATALDPVARAELGAGEAAVIQLALAERISAVAIDERKGRRAALAAGLRVTGTLGLLARAKEQGVVSAVRPMVERLRSERAGWFGEALIAAFLAQMGE